MGNMKPKTQMKILGVRDAQGNKVNLSDLGKAKRHIPLHYQPKVIVENVRQIVEEYKKMNAPKEMLNLYEDMLTLLTWAEQKLPLAPPPDGIQQH